MGRDVLPQGISRIELSMPVAGILPFNIRFNLYAVDTGVGLALFDCGPEQTLDQLRALLADRISQVYLTHGHADHAGSGAYWLRWGIPVAAGPESDMLAAGGPPKALKAFRYPGYRPTRTLNPDDTITMGEYRFVPLAVPGHTPGSMCYYDSQHDVLITGDLLYGPIWGYAGTFLAQVATSFTESKDALVRQIESIDCVLRNSHITASTLILPGHGPPFRLAKDVKLGRSRVLLNFIRIWRPGRR